MHDFQTRGEDLDKPKYTHGAGPGGADWRDPATAMTATAALGKLGIQLDDAAPNDVRALASNRNKLRKAFNELRDRGIEASRNGKGDDAATLAELNAIAAISQRTQQLLDNATGVSLAGRIDPSDTDTFIINGKPVRAMRTADQFRAHYAEASGEHEVGVADFLRGVAGLPSSGAVRASLSVGTDTEGGYSVPSMVMPQILEAMVPASSVLQAGASILPLDEGAKTFTMAAIDSIPSAAWRSENGSVAESDPAFRAIVMTPRSLAFRFKVSRELLMDGVGIDQALLTAIAQAFAKEMDRTALRGTGTAPEPRGVLNTTNVNAVGNGTNGASLATTKYANFMSAVQAILEDDGPMPTAAIMSPRSRVVLGALLDSTGQPVMVPDIIKPMQMLATSQIPNNLTVGSSTDCSEVYFGDFTKLRIAMRERVSVQRLTELYAETGQIGFIGHARVDIAVTYPKAFAVATGVRP